MFNGQRVSQLMLAVSIPGRIWRTTIVFDLTLKELIYFGSVPAFVALPTFYIPFLPSIVSIIVLALATLGIIYIGFRTPTGQNPLIWAPAFFKQRLMPTTYYLKSRQSYRARPVYISKVHTEDKINAEHERGESLDVLDGLHTGVNRDAGTQPYETANPVGQSDNSENAHQEQ